VPDVVLPRVLDAFAGTYHYNAATDGTKAQFAKRKVADYLKGIVNSYEVQLAADAAVAAQNAATSTDLAGVS
jgi:hypothetical protein